MNELLDLWKVQLNTISDDKLMSGLATSIDGICQEFLSEKGSLSAVELSPDDKADLAQRCASLISDRANVDIPPELVRARADQAGVFLGIKEAYIYRDWQAAIGDLMITETSGGLRRFSIMGFGEFEDRYLRAHRENGEEGERRWFTRLEALFHDLDMGKTGMFDARREQLKNLHEGCKNLETYLQSKVSALRKPSGE